MRPVYLCGFMGCGKSHIGRMLARECTAVFIDLDRYIVDNQKMTIRISGILRRSIYETSEEER